MRLVRLARICLVFLIAMMASIFLPEAYWLAFDVKPSIPRVQYSPVIDTFLLTRMTPGGMKFSDARGNTYTREEFEKLSPLANYRQLVLAGAMPESLRGIRLDLREVSLNNISMRIHQATMDAPALDLFPMFESQSGRVRLEMPGDMFRITNRVEFITASTNTLDTAKSRRFTDSLTRAGFVFPSADISGNPSMLKPFDEGYFVTDAAGAVFHVKQVKGQPFCRNTGIPEPLSIWKKMIQEMELREFYGVIIRQDRSVELISYDHYRPVRCPIADYDPSSMTLLLAGDQFFRTFTAVGPSGLQSVVTDRAYRTVATYRETWPTRYEQPAGTVASILFPFTLSLTDAGSMFIRPFVRFSGPAGLVGIFVSLGVMLIVVRLKGDTVASRWFDFVVIACCGIFGLIAANVIECIDRRESS